MATRFNLSLVGSFCSELSKACSSNDRQSDIPDCFIKWKDSFLIYGDYCSNLPVAQEKVDELAKKSPEVQQSVMVSVLLRWRSPGLL